MRQVIIATYQDGVLKPIQKLSLSDQQQVLLVILPLPQAVPPARPNPEKLAAMREQAAVWLSQQPPNATRLPSHLPRAQEQALDGDFDAALAAIRAQTGQFNAAEIVADIEAALAEVRVLSPDEHAGLDAELDAILAEWAADAG